MLVSFSGNNYLIQYFPSNHPFFYPNAHDINATFGFQITSLLAGSHTIREYIWVGEELLQLMVWYMVATNIWSWLKGFNVWFSHWHQTSRTKNHINKMPSFFCCCAPPPHSARPCSKQQSFVLLRSASFWQLIAYLYNVEIFHVCNTLRHAVVFIYIYPFQSFNYNMLDISVSSSLNVWNVVRTIQVFRVHVVLFKLFTYRFCRWSGFSHLILMYFFFFWGGGGGGGGVIPAYAILPMDAKDLQSWYPSCWFPEDTRGQYISIRGTDLACPGHYIRARTISASWQLYQMLSTLSRLWTMYSCDF